MGQSNNTKSPAFWFWPSNPRSVDVIPFKKQMQTSLKLVLSWSTQDCKPQLECSINITIKHWAVDRRSCSSNSSSYCVNLVLCISICVIKYKVLHLILKPMHTNTSRYLLEPRQAESSAKYRPSDKLSTSYFFISQVPFSVCLTMYKVCILSHENVSDYS